MNKDNEDNEFSEDNYVRQKVAKHLAERGKNFNPAGVAARLEARAASVTSGAAVGLVRRRFATDGAAPQVRLAAARARVHRRLGPELD